MSSKSSDVIGAADVAWASRVVDSACADMRCRAQDEFYSAANEELWKLAERTGLRGRALYHQARGLIKYRVVDAIRRLCGRPGSPEYRFRTRRVSEEILLMQPDRTYAPPLQTLVHAEIRKKQVACLVAVARTEPERKALAVLLKGGTLKDAGKAAGRSEPWACLFVGKMRTIVRQERRRSTWRFL